MLNKQTHSQALGLQASLQHKKVTWAEELPLKQGLLDCDNSTDYSDFCDQSDASDASERLDRASHTAGTVGDDQNDLISES